MNIFIVIATKLGYGMYVLRQSESNTHTINKHFYPQTLLPCAQSVMKTGAKI